MPHDTGKYWNLYNQVLEQEERMRPPAFSLFWLAWCEHDARADVILSMAMVQEKIRRYNAVSFRSLLASMLVLAESMQRYTGAHDRYVGAMNRQEWNVQRRRQYH